MVIYHLFALYPFKILEHLIYACVKSTIDPLLPRKQAGFQHERSTIDQVTWLAQDIKESFFATYDTLWHRGLTCKLLHLLPDRHMVKIIMELITNHSFTLTTQSGACSRLRHLNNGVP